MALIELSLSDISSNQQLPPSFLTVETALLPVQALRRGSHGPACIATLHVARRRPTNIVNPVDRLQEFLYRKTLERPQKTF